MGFSCKLDDDIDVLDHSTDCIRIGDVAVDESEPWIVVDGLKVAKVPCIRQLVECDDAVLGMLAQHESNELATNERGTSGDQQASDVLDAPVETDAWVIPRDAPFVRSSGIVWRGDVVVEDDVLHVQRLIPMGDARWDGHHARSMLAEDECLHLARCRRSLAKVDEDDTRVSLDDVPIVPLRGVPVEGLDQLRGIAAAGVRQTSRYLGERLIGDEWPPFVGEVASLELLDELAALVSPLLEGLHHHPIDATQPLGEGHARHRPKTRSMDAGIGGQATHSPAAAIAPWTQEAPERAAG
jgi:hypothetical protein